MEKRTTTENKRRLGNDVSVVQCKASPTKFSVKSVRAAEPLAHGGEFDVKRRRQKAYFPFYGHLPAQTETRFQRSDGQNETCDKT